MSKRLKLRGRFYHSDAHHANHLGISLQTFYRWQANPRAITAAAHRLLSILESLEGTDLHAYLVREAVPPPKPKRSRYRKAR